eukprot:g3240.t1
MPLLAKAGVRVIIIATGKPDQAAKFLDSLGFELPGTLVLDPDKNTHAAIGQMRSSVYQSLVTPFLRHTSTFGVAAIFEALRVSLMNIGPNGSHGSSWQQGGTFAFSHDDGGDNIKCDYGWVESFPGDWQKVEDVLGALGIKDVPSVSFKERLGFVIKQRQKHEKTATGGSKGAFGDATRTFALGGLAVVAASALAYRYLLS